MNLTLGEVQHHKKIHKTMIKNNKNITCFKNYPTNFKAFQNKNILIIPLKEHRERVWLAGLSREAIAELEGNDGEDSLPVPQR